MRTIVHVGVTLAALSVATIAGASPVADASNPLALYPRRLGAKFEDVEARPTDDVALPGYSLRLASWSVVPSSSIPAGWASQRDWGFDVEGFVPHPPGNGSALHLQFDVHASSAAGLLKDLTGGVTLCVVTDPADGAEFAGVAPTADALIPSASTSVPVSQRPPSPATNAFVPIGARRGPMYVRCRLTSLALALSRVEQTVVWRIDVR